MQRIARLSFVLPLLAFLSGAAPQSGSSGDGYRVLGAMAVQHEGRVKPLDTYARLLVKQIYTRETIKLLDDKGAVAAQWEPLAAWLDWQSRPEFWDAQEIIACEYLPLKQKLLSGPAHAALAEAAKRGSMLAEDKARVEAASKDPNVTSADLKAAAKLPGVGSELAARLKVLAHKISPDQKWLSPDDLENGRIDADGHDHSFLEWVAELRERPSPRPDLRLNPEYSALEKKGLETWVKLLQYSSARDGNPGGNPVYDVFAIPSAAFGAVPEVLQRCYRRIRAQAKKGEKEPTREDVSELENDSFQALIKGYHADLKAPDRKFPGEDAEADVKFAEWLREKSAWLPMRLILSTDVAQLDRAGLPEAKVLAFRKAHEALLAAEKDAPGRLPASAAEAMVSAARELGEEPSVAYLREKDVKHATWNDLDAGRVSAFAQVRDALPKPPSPLSAEQRAALLDSARSVASHLVTYPSTAEVGREISYNYFAPFYKAPMAYGIGLVLLLVSLGLNAGPNAPRGALERGLYGLGILGFVSGIGLEVVGFYYRVRITGWAPVTNMYETVVWVALVSSVIGLVIEAIYRKTYAAAAASGVALLATLLAANVSLLDPGIHNLQPVLRSNYWLTIHVLTIVSSYAAFALAMGLGMLAIGYYLSATYRREVPYATLALPLWPALPSLVIGTVGLIYAQPDASGYSRAPAWAAFAFGAVAMIGLFGTASALFGLIGELSSRSPSKATGLGVSLLGLGIAGIFGARALESPLWWPENISLIAPPAILAGLGLAVVVLSRMGAMAQSVLARASKPPAAELAELTPAASAVEPSFAASEGGSVATLTKPSIVAQLRARQEGNTLPQDPRTLAMQATAARIKPLSNFAYRAMQVGVLLVAAGTILGGVWADVSWGRFWGWDAKEVWALITLLVYLIPLHGRFAGWVNTFGLICATVVCFSSVLMAWYGVNFVLNTGLHTYGFAEGGGQGVVLTAVLAVLGIVAGTRAAALAGVDGMSRSAGRVEHAIFSAEDGVLHTPYGTGRERIS